MMRTIIRKEIRLMIREKGNFFWLFLLPILFIVMFASIFGHAEDTITIHYVDEDRTQVSKNFLDGIARIKGIDLQTDDTLSLDQQIQKIKDGKMSALLVVPKGFSEALTSGKSQAIIELYRDPTADQTVAPIQAVLQNMANIYRDEKLASALKRLGKSEPEVRQIMMPPITMKEISENVSKVDMISQVVPGYTVMFAFFIMISMTRSFIKEKESGMLARLRSTPLKPLSYLGGMWASSMLVVLLQCGTLLTFGHFVYKLHVGDVFAIVLIVLGLAICTTGLGLALSMWVRNENQGVGVTQLITMGGRRGRRIMVPV
ncbi:hypothetical protein DNHGIG_17440 [Collibacillus ludicampi]|uniref:ABC-2 type transporter transmembrane domain-containing protein n=2 Tax=Collibacillus ludicampi TaxID=2771369 RepID=A0AAV4LEF3_9BACL|nr:hypothetical protein DNHGIG_17440 [Collibacillus ludicampi]